MHVIEESMKDYTIASTPEEIPKEEHLAIISFGSIHIPGDERSQKKPGHGYPARTETTMTYYVYRSKYSWTQEIRRRVRNHDKGFVAFLAKPYRS
jgi:hypothetical protein